MGGDGRAGSVVVHLCGCIDSSRRHSSSFRKLSTETGMYDSEGNLNFEGRHDGSGRDQEPLAWRSSRARHDVSATTTVNGRTQAQFRYPCERHPRQIEENPMRLEEAIHVVAGSDTQ